MSEETFFACDATGCTAAIRMELADDWIYFHGEYGVFSDTDDPMSEEGVEILAHACCEEHLPSAVFEVANRIINGGDDEIIGPN